MMTQADLVRVTILAVVKAIKSFLGILMAAITLEQIDQNINSLPEEIQVVAEAAFDKLSQPELDAVMASFDLTLGEAPVVNQQEEVMPEPMMEEAAAPVEEPMLEAPMPEPSPMQGQMQRLNIGGGVSGIIDDENVETTDENTVSDKSNVNFPEGAFIINAAAVRHSGINDILPMIEDAADTYERLTGEKIDVGKITRPSEQVQGDVPGAISELEAFIDPRLVPIIGEDRLEKINNRGVKETEQKIEETQPQEGAPPAQPTVRAAPGGKIDKNLDMLSRILFSEAGVDGKEGMHGVANVIMNRIKAKDVGFGNLTDAQKVISQKNAFTSLNNDDYKKPSGPNYKIAKELARQALSAGGLEDITGGALFFRNPNITEKDKPKAATKKEQDKFDSLLASGRFTLSKILKNHEFYVDGNSSFKPGVITKLQAQDDFASDIRMPEERQQGSQLIPDSELPTEENIRRRNQGANTITYFTKDAATR